MRSVTDVGAWQDVVRNLKGRDGEPRPVRIAAITASGFRVAATPPLLGRTLVPADEQAGAPPVVVLGHDVWRARYYRLTAAGRRALGAELESWRRFAAGLEAVLRTT